MGIRAWFHRSKTDGAKPSRTGSQRRLSAVERRNAAKGIPPRPRRPVEPPSDSEFITRYGDPFD
jgi:hypothetical protein